MKIKRLFLIMMFYWVNLAHAKNDFSQVERYVNAVKAETNYPTGTAVAVVNNGEVVYEGYFGYADIGANKKVNEETVFYIASATKPLFALSVLLMEGNGDINERATMGEMFPKLTFPHITKNKIQLKHLVSHTHALENIPMELTLAYTGQHDKFQRQKLAQATKRSTESNLGEFSYSNLGYNLLSVWVENYYNKDWQGMLDKLVYRPLSMNHTSSYYSEAKKNRFDIARPYYLYAKNPREVMGFEKSDATMQSAGGAIASALDMSRFLIAQLNKGKVDGKQIFPTEVIEKSQQKLAVNDLKYRDFKRNGYAWGWYIGPYKNELMFHHFGGIRGTHAHLSFMRDHGLGLVVLNNESTISKELTSGIADIVYSILLNKDDVNLITDSRIKAMRKQWVKLQDDIKHSSSIAKKRNASRVMSLTQQETCYSGVFNNPLWGDLSVEFLESGKFQFTLGGLKALATAGTKPDEFRVQFPAMSGKLASYEIVEGKPSAIYMEGLSYNLDKFTRTSERKD